MEIQAILDELGNEFYEIKKLITNGYCAYSIDDRALGETFKEALANLLIVVQKKRDDHERKIYNS